MTPTHPAEFETPDLVSQWQKSETLRQAYVSHPEN